MSKRSSGQWTFPIPIQFCIAQQTTKIARGGARALPLPSPRFIVCWVPPPRHTHTGKHSGRAGIAQRGTAAVQPACTLKTRVRVPFCRQAEEDYEEEMRHPADAGTSDGARCCRCAVHTHTHTHTHRHTQTHTDTHTQTQTQTHTHKDTQTHTRREVTKEPHTHTHTHTHTHKHTHTHTINTTKQAAAKA